MSELFDAPALATGMLALLNPCGFALFPAYLGYFLGTEDSDENESLLQSLNRSQVVSLALSLGFLVVFATLGLVVAGVYSSIASKLAIVNIILGIGLAVLGLAMMRGYQPVVKLPKMDAGGSATTNTSMFLFGVSYAVASLSCTMPFFLTAVVTGSSTGENASGLSQFGSLVSYGAGMSLLATIFTLLMALGKKNLVNSFKKFMPIINMVSGYVVFIVGLYLANYGWWETNPVGHYSVLVDGVKKAQIWVDNVVGPRAGPLAIGFLVINLIIVIGAFTERLSNRQNSAAS